MTTEEILQQSLSEQKISQAAAQNITKWLKEPKYQEYKNELEELIQAEKWKTLEDSFFTIVPFGTGGRRGTVGIGTNRINKVTIGESAQGFANYLLKVYAEEAKQKGVVIAHDTRTTSRELAEFTACIFAANEFKTYLFDTFRATPELSFAVRHLGTGGGVVISASHNPPADNGFKAYWTDGGQVIPPHDTGIMAEVDAVQEIKKVDFNTAVESGLLQIISNEVDDAYVAAVVNESLHSSRSAVITYSPLHGTGTMSAKPVLEHSGFQNFTVVEEQASPDGAFPNVPEHSPNPENPAASDLVIDYAKRINADIGITTDPDADRLGVVANDGRGNYVFFTGNQIAALTAYYVASQMKEAGKLKNNQFFARTIVTTDFLDAIAQDFGFKIYNNLLIGFKYIGELIRLNQDEGKEEFIFGGEESYGFLKGSYARDKDAAVAALLICELASKLKNEGKNLVWQLNELYRKYGLFWESLVNIKYPGADGFEKMQRIMKNLRDTPPATIGDMAVVRITDRQSGEIIDPQTKEVVDMNDGVKGNVLIYSLSEDNHTRLTVRPSGTEPKLKVYIQTHQTLEPSISDEELNAAKKEADAKAKQLADAIVNYMDSF